MVDNYMDWFDKQVYIPWFKRVFADPASFFDQDSPPTVDLSKLSLAPITPKSRHRPGTQPDHLTGACVDLPPPAHNLPI